MAPGLHPPCTPAAACSEPRCHPNRPSCHRPNACKQTTDMRGLPPCPSAVSILATRGAMCSSCGRINGKDYDNPRKSEYIIKYLKRKEHEAILKQQDACCGTNLYRNYLARNRATPRATQECCAHRGHRGRLKRRSFFAGPKARKKKCSIL